MCLTSVDEINVQQSHIFEPQIGKLNQTIQEAQQYIRPSILPPHHLKLTVERCNDTSRRCGGCDGWKKSECIEMRVREDIERV